MNNKEKKEMVINILKKHMKGTKIFFEEI